MSGNELETRKMFPVLSALYRANRAFGTAVSNSNFFMCSRISQHCEGLRISQHGHPMFFACKALKTITSFSDTILHIVLLCSKKKVFWINTTGVVAPVQHKESLFGRTIFQFIGNSVGESSKLTAKCENAITSVIHGSRPRPTGLAFLNVFPKMTRWRAVKPAATVAVKRLIAHDTTHLICRYRLSVQF